MPLPILDWNHESLTDWQGMTIDQWYTLLVNRGTVYRDALDLYLSIAAAMLAALTVCDTTRPGVEDVMTGIMAQDVWMVETVES